MLYDTWYSFPWSRSTHHGATVATSPAPPVAPNRPPPRPPAALASARTHEVAQPGRAAGDALVVKFGVINLWKNPQQKTPLQKISRIECFFLLGGYHNHKKVPKEKRSSGQIWGEREMTPKIKTKGPRQGLAKNAQKAAPAVYLLKPPHWHHPEATKRPT